MAGASGIRAGRAVVEITADNKVAAGLQAASEALKGFGAGVAGIGGGLTAVGATALTALGAATKLFSDEGDAIAKGAKRLGITTEAYSELKYAADLSGTSIGEVEIGMRAMSRTLENAATGNQAASDSLAKLGLSAASLINLSPEDQLSVMADRISRIQNPTLQAALAMEIFGKSGTQLLPLLNEGSAGIADMRDEAIKLGLSMSGKAAKNAEKLNDALGKLWTSLKQVGLEIGSALAPAITNLAETAAVLISGVSRLIRENQGVIVTVAKVAAGVLAAGVAFTGLGVAIYAAGAAMGVIVPAIAAVQAQLIATKALVVSLYGVIAAPWLLMAGAVGVAVVAVGGAIAYFSGSLDDLIDVVSDRTETISSLWGLTIDGITDSLMAGNIELAAKNMWAGLVAIWQVGTIELDKMMTWVLARYAQMANKLIGGVKSQISTLTSVGSLAAVQLVNGELGNSIGGVSLSGSTMKILYQAIAADWAATQSDIVKEFNGVDSAIAAIESAGYKLAEFEPVVAANRLAELRQQAAEERKAREAARRAKPDFAFEPPDLKLNIPQLTETLGESLRDTISTFGQFGGANLSQIDLVDSLEEINLRTAKAAEQTVKKLDQVREAVLDTGLRFA